MKGNKKINRNSNKKVLNSSELIKVPELPKETYELIGSFLKGLDLNAYSLVCKKFENTAKDRLHQSQLLSIEYFEKAKTEKLDIAMQYLDEAYELNSSPLKVKDIVEEALQRIKSYIQYLKSSSSHMEYVVKIAAINTNERDRADINNKVFIKNELITEWKVKWKKREKLCDELQSQNTNQQKNSRCVIA